ncbi:GDSL-type esterase/lipase family protein [Mucilaginibacter sp. MD40]|uniref:SGNH/GDSL hydrolase family protein n=1 Tax=Mucilaginibacter sp. MD40 TaxID=2029590 RepID=UPI001303F4B5|nr:GDSL-type esterase/lipase family protein [Mucilaginibacter sp. MD40]
MKPAVLISCLLLFAGTLFAQQPDSLRYLALGDSYTVGRGVAQSQSFPYQLVAKLRQKNIPVTNPVLIAQNGWRTDELLIGINEQAHNARYNFITLLIGVNNQYQHKDTAIYRSEFKRIITKAIDLAGGNNKHVFVLSVPDWGVTPFANGRNRDKIAAEIDGYNAINKQITQEAGATYVAITDLTRDAGDDKAFVTTDNLHPSPKMYGWWVDRLSKAIVKTLKN